jgi:MoxR-like ATPase
MLSLFVIGILIIELFTMNPHLSSARDIILSLEEAIKSDIIGQHDLIRKLLITLFSSGHALIEWVPWLGKTRTVKTLAKVLGYDSKRISFTPDLLPTDLTGTEIYRPQTGKFDIRKWPIFTSILLADEINRTPPKVQSALLEAMEEGQVTIGNETLALPSPFFVIATENPLEHEGTYPLPEAELDRFFMKIIITYPSPEDEKKIFSWSANEQTSTPTNELKTKELVEMRDYIAKNILVDAKVYDYVSDILEATRSRSSGDEPMHLEYGASTRAGLALIDGGRVVALLEGREYVTPDDIKYLAHDILRHRIGLSYEAISLGISPDQIITEILGKVKIP